MAALDEKFVWRVYRTSGWLTALAAVECWGRWDWEAALGIVLGSGLFLGCLYAIERGVRKHLDSRGLEPGARGGARLRVYLLGLYPPMMVILWAVVQSHIVNMAAFAAGVTLPMLVIVLKVWGRNFMEKRPS